MKIAVVIPCYRVKSHILSVIKAIGSDVTNIYVIDDSCPDGSGNFVLSHCKDRRLKVITHEVNQGVGGAMITGYRAALADNNEIVIKIDGDGQMDPRLLGRFVKPILKGQADYTKGNRFFTPEYLAAMPKTRLVGNAFLSFVNKIISGYWDIMDPTNGYTAIHSTVLKSLPLDKLDHGYFFESDMLVRLNIARAVVKDISMTAIYQDECSNLKITKTLFEFPFKYINRFFKRLFYNYFLRDFNIGSLALVFGLLLNSFGIVFGLNRWIYGGVTHTDASSGTVMLAALPIIVGFQLILFSLQFDIMSVPKVVLSNKD